MTIRQSISSQISKSICLLLLFISAGILSASQVSAGSNNTLFTCTFGDPLYPQIFTITAQDLGSSTTATTLSATGAVRANPPPGYEVSMNLYQYRCACPNVNQATCGGPGDGEVCTLQTQAVINQGQTTSTTNLTSSCATLQSDVNLGGVRIRYGSENWMSATCTGNATLSPELKQISAYARYMCLPAPTSTATPTSTPPTTAPTTTPTATPTTPPPTPTTPPPTSSSTSFWQVFSGLVYVKNSLLSRLPFKPTTNNPPNFLINRFLADTINSAGLVQMESLAPSNLNLGEGQITNRADDQRMSQVRGHQETACQQFTYPYFLSKLLTSSERAASESVARADITISDLNNISWLPPRADSTRVAFYRGKITLSPSTIWEVASNKYVIIVDGDVLISDVNGLSDLDQSLLTMSDAGFFGIIASGNITIDSNVGWSSPDNSLEQASLAGMYLAYGNLDVGTTGSAATERQFVGSGSFIGCRNVSLPRSYGDNPSLSSVPTEQFIYRPSLIYSVPKALSELSLTWQEVL